MPVQEHIRIVFVRHGRSRADDEGVHEGRYDSPLTEVGRKQVQNRTNDFLNIGFSFDHIIASPLVRAVETAQIIGKVLKVPVEYDPDWMEIDNGPLQGMRFEEADLLYPMPTFRNPYENIHGGGESQWQLFHRAGRALERVIVRGKGSYMVVAHGMVLNAAIKNIVGIVPAANHQGIMFSFGDVGFYHFEYNPDKHIWWLKNFMRGD